jgi:hypothetical protein
MRSPAGRAGPWPESDAPPPHACGERVDVRACERADQSILTYYKPLIHKYDQFSNRSKMRDFTRRYSSFCSPTTSPDLFLNRVYERSEFGYIQGAFFFWFCVFFFN